MPQIIAHHFARARVLHLFGEVAAHQDVQQAVAVIIQEGGGVEVAPAIDAGLVADVGERPVAAVEIERVGAAPLHDVKVEVPVVVEVAPDRVHAAPLAVGAADAGGGGHILERPVAPVPKQVVVIVPSGVGDVKVGITVIVIVGGRGGGADRAEPGHDIREDVAQDHHRMHVAAAGGGSALLEVDVTSGIYGLPRGEPEIAGPEESHHQKRSKNAGHTPSSSEPIYPEPWAFGIRFPDITPSHSLRAGQEELMTVFSRGHYPESIPLRSGVKPGKCESVWLLASRRLDGARTVCATDLALLAASPQLPSALVPAALPGPATLPDAPNRDNPPGMGGRPTALPRQRNGSATVVLPC